MKRILFVDDEPAILDGLKNLLRKQRRVWDMTFADGGQAALDVMAKAPADVVVSDMRMPGMDGAMLLQKIKQEHPQAVRLILSGHADRESVFRVLPLAHQFLTKPCDADALRNVIERACELHELISDDALLKVIVGIEKLPSPPHTYWRITEAMADPNVGAADIAQCLEEDPAVCAKLLQLVNSGYFGLAAPVASVQQAVAYLGLDSVRSLVLSSHILCTLSSAPSIPNFSYESLQAYALLTAKVAKRIMSGSRLQEECFTAALLHDLGKIILASAFPAQFARLIELAKTAPGSDHAREKELLGVSHAELGAYLLGLWGLPNPIVEAVAYHHAPASVAQRGFEVVGCVHVADALVDGFLPSIPGVTCGDSEPDAAYLASLGVLDKLPEWRAIAEEEARLWKVAC